MALGLSPEEIVEKGEYQLLAKAHHWERVSLSDVANVQNGFAFKSEYFDRENGVPLIRIRDISNSDTEHRYNGDYDDQYVVRTGEVLIGMDGDFVASRWKGREALLNQRVCKLTVTSKYFDEKFFFLCLQPYLNAINAETSSVTVKHLSSKTVETLPLPLPPRKEQRRIVAKIEELFSELDKGIENLKTAREQLNLYRLSILDQATGGAQSIGFETHALGDLIGPIQQGWSPKCDLNRQPSDGEWAIIKTTAVQPMHYIPLECKPLPEALEPRPRIEVLDGDILMTRKGPRPRTGVVCYVKKARPRSMLCDTVYRFRANEGVVLPQYLEIALNAPRVLAEINEKKSGINDSGISLNHGRIKSLRIPVPPDRDRQKNIVQAVEQQLSVVASIETELDKQFEQCEVLRQAILKKAFSGQLVEQDPNDEPAYVLLERIKKEKVSAASPSQEKRERQQASA